MNELTLIKCGCCKESTSSSKTIWDQDISEHVCMDCAKGLKNADSAMRVEFATSCGKAEYPKLYNGPFCGSSNG